MKSALSIVLSVVFVIQQKYIAAVIGQNDVGIQDEISGTDLKPQVYI